MKKKIFAIITLILVATCFIACTQNQVETTATSLQELSKPFVEVELTPSLENSSDVIMKYS